MIKKKYFPWRFFLKLSLTSFALSSVLLLLFYFLLSHLRGEGLFESQMLLLLGFLIMTAFMVSLVLAYRFSLPMRRVMLKALRMANKRLYFELQQDDSEDEERLSSEAMEYFELEQSLDQIRSKLKRRREQLAQEREESKTLLSSIEDAVVSIGPDGKVLFFNAGFATHFLPRDFHRHEGDAGPALTQLVRDAELIDMFDQGLQEGKSSKIQKTLMTIQGQERIFWISVVPLRDPKEEDVFEVMGIFHDITEMKLTERIRIEFVENASHELRTPLTAVKGYLDTLKEDFKAGRTQQSLEFLDIVIKNVGRLNTLVDDLLTLSSLEHGPKLKIEALNPDELTKEVTSKLEPLMKQKKIQFEYKNSNVKLVYADAAKLEQVLSNLIGNAIKYNHDNGKISVTWTMRPDHKLQILSVKDNGPGIAKEHQTRLFERFYRIDKARSREVGGTGLGLAIVKHIMLIHGGRIFVQSDRGSGAEFICEFPVQSSGPQA